MSFPLHGCFDWTDDAVGALRKHFGAGLSASQIAIQIGCPSRNAVIGKLTRLGLTRSGHPKPPRKDGELKTVRRHKGGLRGFGASASASPLPKGSQQIARERRAAEQRAIFAAEEVTDLPPDDASTAVTLLQLEPHQCRWPLGDPRNLDAFRHCGAERHNERPYCLRHCRMAYVKPKPVPHPFREALRA